MKNVGTMEMEDVQSMPAEVPLTIDCVGIRGLSLPVLVRGRDDPPGGGRHTVASVDIGVDLPASSKGTHMSRFVEGLRDWTERADALDCDTMGPLLGDILDRLHARRVRASFRFPYLLERRAPISGLPAAVPCPCVLTGTMAADDGAAFAFDVTVPVMTVCPCSKAISDEGAHAQRADVHMHVGISARIWIEDLVDMTTDAASSPVYSLLKREDEKYVTEHAFARPVFVEDVVRGVALRLSRHPKVLDYAVEVESYESIHAHNAFARIEGRRASPTT